MKMIDNPDRVKEFGSVGKDLVIKNMSFDLMIKGFQEKAGCHRIQWAVG